MPKPTKFSYTKKAPYRDAFFFIIVCEGSNREPDYFRFFDGLSSRVKIVPVQSVLGNSAPNKLIAPALKKEKELKVDKMHDCLWFVIDTDRWREQLHELRAECDKHPHWKVAQSNPCFEVWLYFHAKAVLPELPHIEHCNNWKPLLPNIIKGGFNTDFHPVAMERAIVNAEAAYSANGHFPNPGSTQVWQLGKELWSLIAKDLETLKGSFPEPEVIG